MGVTAATPTLPSDVPLWEDARFGWESTAALWGGSPSAGLGGQVTAATPTVPAVTAATPSR